MEATAVALPKHRHLWLWGCLGGLIWFGTLTQVSAQPVLPVPGQKTNLKEPDKKKEANGKDEKEEPKKALSDKASEVTPALPVLTLGDCIRQAHECSPVLKAVRITVESALAGQRGIEKTSRIVHTLISPELPYRKQQAAKGVIAAEAEMMQTEHDVTFNVVRTYYTAVYARQQVRLTSEIVKRFRQYLAFVKEAVDEGSIRTLTKTSEETFVQYVARAIDKQTQAEFGYRRAMEALRHEMAVGEEFQFTIATEELPLIDASISREAVVAHALNRRGEITLASMGAEVLRLETTAQGEVRFRLRVPTAASASDLHSKNVPQGTREGEYRPDALAPDFPTTIIGDRTTRTEKAAALTQRAEVVVEKTRDLVKLEAVNGYLKWEESRKRVPEWKIAAEAGRSSVERGRKDVDGKPTDEKILQLEGLAAESQGSYNEALYQQLMALAVLERATAGGIKVNYPGR